MSSVEPEIHQQYGQSQVADLAGRRAYDQAWRRFAGEQSPEEFCRSWLLIQSHMIGGVSDGVVILNKPGTSTFAPVAFYPENSGNRTHLASVSERALKEGRGVIEPHTATQPEGAAGPRYQLAYPVRVDGRVRGVIGVDIEWRPDARLQAAIRDLQWGSGWVELMLRRHADLLLGGSVAFSRVTITRAPGVGRHEFYAARHEVAEGLAASQAVFDDAGHGDDGRDRIDGGPGRDQVRRGDDDSRWLRDRLADRIDWQAAATGGWTVKLSPFDSDRPVAGKSPSFPAFDLERHDHHRR